MHNVPGELHYTKEHEWAKVDGRLVRVGITDYAQAQLGDVVYVELPQPGARVEFMKPFGVVESVKAASDLYAPVSGVVRESNAGLESAPELVNRDPYGDGWLVVVEVADPQGLHGLMTAEAYQAYLGELEGA